MGANDLTSAWHSVVLFFTRCFVCLSFRVRVCGWRVLFGRVRVRVCACALSVSVRVSLVSSRASLMNATMLVSPLGSLITCSQSGGGMHRQQIDACERLATMQLRCVFVF